VAILHPQSVCHLKDAIKKRKENALSRIDPDRLSIWKVSYPVQRTRHYSRVAMRHVLQLKNPFPSRDIADKLGKIDTGKKIPDADRLDPLADVSDYFTEAPIRKMLHLVVEVHSSGEYQPFAPSCQCF